MTVIHIGPKLHFVHNRSEITLVSNYRDIYYRRIVQVYYSYIHQKIYFKDHYFNNYKRSYRSNKSWYIALKLSQESYYDSIKSI
jgi:hypothetical protein